jgi:hypothetical protein
MSLHNRADIAGSTSAHPSAVYWRSCSTSQRHSGSGSLARQFSRWSCGANSPTSRTLASLDQTLTAAGNLLGTLAQLPDGLVTLGGV